MSDSNSTTTKRCSKCGEEKSLDEFTPCFRKSHGVKSYCRECENVRARELRLNRGAKPRRQSIAVAVLPGGAKQISGYDGYWLTADGKVYSSRLACNGNSRRRAFRQMVTVLATHGYITVSLRKNGYGRIFYLHELLLSTFVGPRPIGQCGRHLDDNKMNNHLSNLAWGTPKENHQDAVRNGRIQRGEKIWSSVMTEEEVRKMRKLWNSGMPSLQIANLFGKPHAGVYQAVTCRTWKHLDPEQPCRGKYYADEFGNQPDASL